MPANAPLGELWVNSGDAPPRGLCPRLSARAGGRSLPAGGALDTVRRRRRRQDGPGPGPVASKGAPEGVAGKGQPHCPGQPGCASSCHRGGPLPVARDVRL